MLLCIKSALHFVSVSRMYPISCSLSHNESFTKLLLLLLSRYTIETFRPLSILTVS